MEQRIKSRINGNPATTDKEHRPFLPCISLFWRRATIVIVLSAAVLVLSETVLVIESGLPCAKTVAAMLFVRVNPIADGCRNRLRERAPSPRD